jgi:hypothetical protein
VADDPSAFRDAFDRWVEATYPAPADHPPAERWAAFLDGQLPAAEVERCEDHLVRCRDCCDLVTAVDAFREPEAPLAPEGPLAPDRGDEIAAAALLRLVRQRIRESPEGLAAPGATWPRALTSLRLPYALAAALFAALVGMIVWNLHQSNALARSRAPQADAQIADLAPPARAASPAERELPARTGPITLVLHPTVELPAYRLIVRDAASGRARFPPIVLRPDADGALTFLLPEGLPPGRYRLELLAGSGPGGNRQVDAFPLRVEEAARRD